MTMRIAKIPKVIISPSQLVDMLPISVAASFEVLKAAVLNSLYVYVTTEILPL